MAKILVIDDDAMLSTMLVDQLDRIGHAATGVSTLTDGVNMVGKDDFDVVFLDVQLPDGNGLEFLPEFKAAPSSPEVIIMTGKGDPDGAEKAITSGAWAYIEKPHVVRDLLLHLTRALQYREETKRIKKIPVALKRGDIIGSSNEIAACLDMVAKSAASEVSVLITGETGTGKELFAWAIHENSNRVQSNFVIVDCAALPETLIESTLFGYSKGAFTGADNYRDGLIKHADGGTLFLDEVGELPLNTQKTFLRVLQEHRYRPVGSSREKHSDFRLVAASNRNLEECVQAGTFRSDLLFRLQAFSITLPPLKTRISDIRELTTFYIEKLCKRYGRETKGIAPDFIEALSAYDWPGNIRELFQVLELVLANAIQSPTLFSYHLPKQFRILQAQAGIQGAQPSPSSSEGPPLFDRFPSWRQNKECREKEYVQQLMLHSKGSIKEACRICKLSRTRLYQLLHKYDLYSTTANGK
ncbi:MAG: sigma-54 dependent transcriptional regulator [Desulfocapsa sp.]|nr:sigma-54 dependent transcriptional regulator [Desulfocapsa sp.]